MSENDFLAYATAGGANVVTQATYAAAGYVTAGRGSGILPSNVYNKIARQGNWIAYCIAQFMVDTTGNDVLDDGNYTTWLATFQEAIVATSPTNASTGDAKLTLKVVADSGWLLMNDGTIGNPSSGAGFADATAQNLFTLIWDNIINTWAPIYTSAGAPTTRGVSAVADWAANCRLSLTLQLGRAICIAGAGNGLTSRALGQTLGEETHLLTTPEIPAHSHSASVTDPAHNHRLEIPNVPLQGGNSGSLLGLNNPAAQGAGFSAGNTNTAVTGISVTIGNTGGGGAHNNMPPSAFWSVLIKL